MAEMWVIIWIKGTSEIVRVLGPFATGMDALTWKDNNSHLYDGRLSIRLVRDAT